MELFRVDGIVIATPTGYKPVFATTSTEDSARDQMGDMYNTPMFTIGGYDLSWKYLNWDEISTLLDSVLGKSNFSFHHKSPLHPGHWIDAQFYASNFNMATQTLEEGEETWKDLTINVRSTHPV